MNSHGQDLSWVLIDFDPATGKHTITGLNYDDRLDPEKSQKAIDLSQAMDAFDTSHLPPLEKAAVKCVSLALRDMSVGVLHDSHTVMRFHYGPIIGWARMRRFDFELVEGFPWPVFFFDEHWAEMGSDLIEGARRLCDAMGIVVYQQLEPPPLELLVRKSEMSRPLDVQNVALLNSLFADLRLMEWKEPEGFTVFCHADRIMKSEKLHVKSRELPSIATSMWFPHLGMEDLLIHKQCEHTQRYPKHSAVSASSHNAIHHNAI